MKLTSVDFGEALPIDGYGPGFFRIGGDVFKGNVIASGSTVSNWSGFDDLEPLLALKSQVDVIFCGMGADIAHLPADVAKTLRDAGVATEVMASSAACRTYNVLLSEERRVAAALLAV